MHAGGGVRIVVNQTQAAEILGVNPRTLEGWRQRGEGPPFVKYGGRVVYEIADLEAFKVARRRLSTSDRGASVTSEPTAHPSKREDAQRILREAALDMDAVVDQRHLAAAMRVWLLFDMANQILEERQK
jgi:DNA-binding transcriptional MerR regulator